MQRLLVVLDCDSTLIQEEVIELIADLVGVRQEVAAVTEQAMRGELDFRESLTSRVRLLQGASLDDVRSCAARVHPSPGLTELVTAVHAADGAVGVVSGGFHEVMDEFAPALGIDTWKANRLEVIDGILTGELRGELIDAKAKAQTLETWAADLGIPLSRAVAIGDGANDLLMMERAGLGIAFNAKPLVREQASLNIADSLAHAIPALQRLG